MKVIVLGGAGGMGAGGASLLLHYPEVEPITLADINLEKAQEVVKQFDNDKVKAKKLDVLDENLLVETLKKFDVVLNAVGPYVKFAILILKAAIKAGVDYVDVCDDHDATQMLLEMNDEVMEADISALICMGTTPGISNMQAKLAASYLDEIENLKVCWAVGLPPYDKVKDTPYEAMADMSGRDLLTDAAWEHMLHVSTGDVPIWNKGKWDVIPALESGEYVDFAEPLGRVESYYLGHAEPITLPRYFKINNFCACLGALMLEVTRELRMEARGHEKALHPPVQPSRALWKAPEKWQKRGVWAGQAAIAEGFKDGTKRRYTSRLMMAIEDIVPYNYAGQAIGVYLMGQNKIKEKGVLAPEEVLEVEPFFDELTKLYNIHSGDQFTPEELVLVEEELLA